MIKIKKLIIFLAQHTLGMYIVLYTTIKMILNWIYKYVAICTLICVSNLMIIKNLTSKTKSLNKIKKYQFCHNSWQHKSKGINKKEKELLPSELLLIKTSDFNKIDQLHYLSRKCLRIKNDSCNMIAKKVSRQ